MALLTHAPSWLTVTAMLLTYLFTLAVYRLYFHPLARFPGPKLAAISRWYEAYYDVVHEGKYTFEIAEMHRRYGPVVRISPFELHINDSAFFEKLYRNDGVWKKYSWSVDAAMADGAIMFTVDDETHRARRTPLNPFFSKARVASHVEMIRLKVARLCERLADGAAGSDTAQVVNVGTALSAFQRDVATQYVIGKSYDSLESDDFDASLSLMIVGSGKVWRWTKHMPWFGPILLSIPKTFLIKYGDERISAFTRYVKATEEDTHRLLKEASSTTAATNSESYSSPRTIVHEIFDSKLPLTDKSPSRVFSDVATIVGAGLETTAGVLRLVLYKVFTDAKILKTLRAELAAAAAESGPDMDLRTLEQLPYLGAVLTEGLRFSPPLGSRLQRIAPDRDLVWAGWRIPAGTPVGMTTMFMHMDANVYPDPYHFNPDRWLAADAYSKREKTFAPFSRGSRICLGMNLAWANIYLVLSTLVQRFNFDFKDVGPDHFDFESDQFADGVKGKGMLRALVTNYRP